MRQLKKIILMLIPFLLFGEILAQRNIDSLIGKLEDLPNDTNSVITIARYGNEQKRINLDAAARLFQMAYKRSKLLKNDFMIARSALMLGSTYGLLSDFEKESMYLTEAKKIAEAANNKPLLTKINLTIGNIYSYNNQTKKAMEIYEECLKLCDEINDQASKATIYNNIGGLIYRESDLKPEEIQKAIKYYNMAIDITEKYGPREELISKYCNIALMFCDINKPDSALYFLSKAKVYIDEKNLPDDLITYYSYLGRVYTDLKDFDKAEKNYLASIDESKKLNNPEWISEGYLALSDMYIAKKEFEPALDYIRKYYTIHDSVVNVTNFAKAADIQNKFERDKKEAELNQLKAEQSRNRIFNIGLILISVLLVLSGLMMFSRFRIKTESEKKLKFQNEIITQKNKDITDSINYSRKIQDAILPPQKNISELFPENFVLYKPKDIISGDFYWCAANGHLKFFAVADCTGHGVPGALMSMLGTSLLKEIILTRNIRRTDEILNELRRLVINALDQDSGNKDGMDIALVCVDEKNKELHFSGANNGAVIIQAKKITELKPDKQPIGMYDNLRDFSSQTIQLNVDTLVYLFSDGFADQFGGPKGKKFKYRQLNELISEVAEHPLSKQKEILDSKFEEWRNTLEQVDDVCVAGLKITL